MIKRRTWIVNYYAGDKSNLRSAYLVGIDNGIVIDMDIILLSQLTFDNILTIAGLQVKGHDITDNILQQAVNYSWRGIAAN